MSVRAKSGEGLRREGWEYETHFQGGSGAVGVEGALSLAVRCVHVLIFWSI